MSQETKIGKPHYIDNKEFLREMIHYGISVRRSKRLKEPKPRVPEYIGECFIKIANHLAFKHNFINYTYREDMILDAIENCLIYVDNFDPKKSSNPFAYFTQIAFYAFVRRIVKEQRQQHTKFKYIDQLDIQDVILQAQDSGEYGNEFVAYLKKQADLASTELEAERNKPKKMTRRPMYMSKRKIKKKPTKAKTKKRKKR
jgi:hypothetical protein